MGRPENAIGVLDGLIYKIGHLGFAYYFHNEEWIKSSKKPDYVVSKMKSKENPFSND